MARNGPRRWSVSAAQVLEQCLFQFRLKYVDRIDAPPRDIPLHWRRGTVVHAGLEAAFKHRKADRKAVGPMMTPEVWEAAKAGIAKSWKEEDMPPPEESEGMWDDVHKMVEDTLDAHECAWEDIVGVEKKLLLNGIGLELIGFIDLLLFAEIDGVRSFIIRDWKTTKTKKTVEELASNFQGHTYAGVLRRLGLVPEGMPVYFQHYYPPIQETVEVLVTVEQGEAAITRIRAARDVAHHETEFAPEKGSWCDGCAYRAMCPAWQAENEQQELVDQVNMF